MKYSISRKSSYAQSNLKINFKKNCIELEFQESSSLQKKFYKCDCPIFREPYSGVLKPYSGVFLQNFL